MVSSRPGPMETISTGTPAGVGMAMEPRSRLEPGDVIRIEIERIGWIENPVVEEPADTPRI